MKLISYWSLVGFVLLSLVSVTVNAPVDCVVSDWSEWHELADDPIWETRSRTIIQFPSDGGAECPTPLEEFRRNVCRRKIDLLFAIDGSMSVGADNFDKVNKAIITGLMTLSIDAVDGVQVGIIVFSDTVTTQITFLGTRVDVVGALLGLDYPEAGTRTDLALNAAGLMFQQHARSDSEPLLMLLTDGMSNKPSRTKRSAIALRAQGITVAVIGITDSVRDSEIKFIASVPRLAFFADTFDVFVSLLKPITQEICDISKDLNVTALPPEPTEEVPVETSSCIPEIVVSTVMEECPTTTVVSTLEPDVVVTTVLEECPTVTVELTPTPTTEIVVSTVEPACPSPSTERIVSTVVEECETVTIESTPDPIRTTVVSTFHSVCPAPSTEVRPTTVTTTEECPTVTLEITPTPVTEVIVSTVPPDCPTTPPPTIPTTTASTADISSGTCPCPETCRASCCKLEVVFAIKVTYSSDVGAITFARTAFDSAIGYIRNVFQTSYFTDDVLDDMRVGFLVYSSDIEHVTNLQEYDNKQSLLDAVESVPYSQGDPSSRVDLALRRASVMWHSKCATRLIVVFTDGDEHELALANLPTVKAENLEDVSVVAVGIRNNNGELTTTGLNLISSEVIVLNWLKNLRKRLHGVLLSC